MRLALREVLERHNITGYRLAEASGLSRNTVYSLLSGEVTAVRLDTLEALLKALEALIGAPVGVEELLKREPAS